MTSAEQHEVATGAGGGMDVSPEQPSQMLGPSGMIDRTEFLRLMQQSLRSLGYEAVARHLESDSGVQMQSDHATQFHQAVLLGEWERAAAVLQQLPLSDHARAAVKFLILEHKYLELLGRNDTLAALATLREGLAPIATLKEHSTRLHSLASLLVQCEGEGPGQAEGLAHVERQALSGMCSGSERGWVATGATKCCGPRDDRRALMQRVRAYLPPSLLLPERRLECLVEQALLAQLRHCVYHNQQCIGLTLFEDYNVGEEQLPSRPAQCISVGHTDEVWALAFNPSGTILASGGKDTTVVLWKVEGTELQFAVRLAGHRATIVYVKWRPDGLVIMSGTTKTLVFHSVSGYGIIHTLESASPGTGSGANPEQGDFSAACWHPDGRTFVVAKFTAGRTNVLETHVLTTTPTGAWSCERTSLRHVPRINDMHCLPSGKHIVAITNEHSIEILNLETGARLVRPQGEGILSMSVSSNGEYLLVIFQRHVLHLWRLLEASGGSKSDQRPSNSSSHDNGFFGSSPEEVGYDVVGSKHPAPDGSDSPLRQYTFPENRASRFHQPCCLGGMNDAFLAFSDDSCKIHIKHRETGRDLKELTAHTANVNALAWNPTCPHMLVSGSDDRTIRVWLSDVVASESSKRK